MFLSIREYISELIIYSLLFKENNKVIYTLLQKKSKMEKFEYQANKCMKYTSLVGTSIYALLWSNQIVYIIQTILRSRAKLTVNDLLIPIGVQLFFLFHIILCFLTLYKGYKFWLMTRFYFRILVIIKSSISGILIVYAVISYHDLSLEPPDESKSFSMGLSFALFVVTCAYMALFGFSVFPLLFLYDKNEKSYNKAYYELNSNIAKIDLV